jgi:hypothetical protein
LFDFATYIVVRSALSCAVGIGAKQAVAGFVAIRISVRARIMGFISLSVAHSYAYACHIEESPDAGMKAGE